MTDLSIARLEENACICNLPSDYIAILKKHYSEVSGYFSEYHEMYYKCWPQIPREFGDRFTDPLPGLSRAATHALYIMIILAGVQRSQERYRELGYPEKMWREIMPDLYLHLQKVDDKTLLHKSSIWWSFEILSIRTVQLGRLQFQTFKFNQPYSGYRNKTDGSVVLLSGEEFTADSQKISGYPAVNGQFASERITLPANQYEKFLEKGSDMLIIHIPAGEKLDISACRESLKRAKEFFGKHHPELDFKGFMCMSWLLDHRLQAYLGDDSNITKFQKLGLLYPFPNKSLEALDRVFGTRDISKLKPGNRLQSALLDILRKGEDLCEGGMFIDYNHF